MTRPEAHLDARTFRLIAAVAAAAKELDIEWMVTGASGRWMLLETVYGLPRGRATEDVDLGVMVADWAMYLALVDGLCRDGAFQRDLKQRQRLRSVDNYPLDLVPFGDIESSKRMIRWPPDGAFAMSVMGFREAYADAIEVDAGNLVVRVVSPAGLMLLKLLAWAQRRFTQPGKDAADMAYVLRHFGAVLTTELLFENHLVAIEEASYDLDMAACRVLGQEVGAMAATDTYQYVIELLKEELSEQTDSALVRDIERYMAGADDRRAYRMLESFREGFGEIP